MIKCDHLQYMLSALLLIVAAFPDAQCQCTNLLLNHIEVLKTQSLSGNDDKDFPSLLKQTFGEDMQRVNTFIDCQDQDSYTKNTILIKRVIKEFPRNNWFVVQIPLHEEVNFQECKNRILVDTINNNYKILNLTKASSEKQFSRDGKFIQDPDDVRYCVNLFSFFSNSTEKISFLLNKSNKNSYSGIQVMRQGFGSIEILLIMALIIVTLLGIAAFIFFKKRKNKNAGIHGHAQKKVERQRFIPSSHTLSFDSHLDHSKHGLNEGRPSQKKTLPALNTEDVNQVLPKLFTPNFKGASLKMDDGEKLSAINDNMFNQIDSPKSVEDLEYQSQRSAKNAPEDIDFNVEFSIIEPAKKTIADE